MTTASSSAVWTFDDFRPGSVLGRLSIVLDAQRIANWTGIYGSPATPERLPSGMLVAAMMEAYLRPYSHGRPAISTQARD